jgi:hypothetical protein
MNEIYLDQQIRGSNAYYNYTHIINSTNFYTDLMFKFNKKIVSVHFIYEPCLTNDVTCICSVNLV